jgi:chaperone modulatory protein CbpM
MAQQNTVTGLSLEEVALSLDELAHACEVEPDWVVRHVRAGVLGVDESVELRSYVFRSGDLVRARRLVIIERTFDANEDIAALVVDLGEEIRRLRARLRVLGLE